MAEVSLEKLTYQIVQESVQEAKGKLPASVCAEWPTARKILQDISNAVTNPWVKLIIAILILIGNELCPS
jgi:hypothetical protein